MNKIIKVDGITLLQMIMDGEIDNGTYINEIMKGYEKYPNRIIYCNDSLWHSNNENRKDEEMEIRVSSILARDSIFEIIEEDEEPKEIELLDIKCENERTGNCYILNENGTKCFLTKHSKMIIEQQNKLAEAVNYLLKKD